MIANAVRYLKLDQPSTRTGILLICLVSFIWALMEVVTQLAAVEYSLYQVVWVRYLTHILFMVIVFAPRHGRALFATRRLGLQLLRALMMLVMPVSFILAVNYITVGNILSIFWLAPLMLIVLSMLLMKEAAPWPYWVIAVAGFLCIIVITHPNLSLNIMGVILSLAMGLSFSLYIALTRVLREETTLANLFYTAIGVLIPLSFRLPVFWKPLTLQGGFLMALVGLLGFALLWVLDKAMEKTSAAMVAPFLYTQMFWMIVLRLVEKFL